MARGLLGRRDGARGRPRRRRGRAERLIDGPGVVPEARSPGRYARPLLGACAALGPGPAGVDSRGDDPATIDACTALGFSVAERVAGRELRPA